ncbi:hypothetical protein B0H14DRAFT_3556404 [Mycena olivaceomarginata]|nr:hypothetical protein B0H14DRAFT_3556404 [Mycena olivaceomarginata]
MPWPLCAVVETPSPQTHLHRFHGDAESPPPAARDSSIPPTPRCFTGYIACHPNVAPTLASPLSISKPAFLLACCGIADRAIAIRSSNAIHRARQHADTCSVYRSRAFYPAAAPCSSQLDAHCPPTFPPTLIPARLDTTGAPAPLPHSSTPTPPRSKPHLHGDSLNGEYSDGDGTTRTDARASVANGSHAARMRAGAIRAKAKIPDTAVVLTPDPSPCYSPSFVWVVLIPYSMNLTGCSSASEKIQSGKLPKKAKH